MVSTPYSNCKTLCIFQEYKPRHRFKHKSFFVWRRVGTCCHKFACESSIFGFASSNHVNTIKGSVFSKSTCSVTDTVYVCVRLMLQIRWTWSFSQLFGMVPGCNHWTLISVFIRRIAIFKPFDSFCGFSWWLTVLNSLRYENFTVDLKDDSTTRSDLEALVQLIDRCDREPSP